MSKVINIDGTPHTQADRIADKIIDESELITQAMLNGDFAALFKAIAIDPLELAATQEDWK